MDAEDIAVGMQVRYPRTGTTGKVERIEKIGEDTYAELDCTHLMYRVDQLVIARAQETRERGERTDYTEMIEKEREFARDQDAWKNTDHSCEGGG
jgi:hypothetical protein